MSLYREELDRYPETMTRYDSHLLGMESRINALKDEQFAASDLIVANSDFVRQTFVDAGIAAEKIIVIPGAGPRPPIDPPPPRAGGPMVFMTAGTLSIRKGTPYLLEAWRRLRSRSGCALWMFGKCTLPKQLVENLPENVRMTSTVSSAELSDAYSRASVLVLPSLCEGFALVILEAMAHGLPVITTPNSGCGNFVEDGVNGWVVPIRDPDALADRMSWCIENPGALRSMGENSRQKARNWTWEKYAGAHAGAILRFMRRTSPDREKNL
jgi:glycosyltransferase involved in cell wall biosynthesis